MSRMFGPSPGGRVAAGTAGSSSPARISAAIARLAIVLAKAPYRVSDSTVAEVLGDEPDEERFAAALPQPGQDRPVHMAGRAFVIPGLAIPRRRPAQRVQAALGQVVVVEIKSLGGSELPCQGESPDCGGGPVPLRLQDFGQGIEGVG